mgnify:CR=1 FL=1
MGSRRRRSRRGSPGCLRELPHNDRCRVPRPRSRVRPLSALEWSPTTSDGSNRSVFGSARVFEPPCGPAICSGRCCCSSATPRRRSTLRPEGSTVSKGRPTTTGTQCKSSRGHWPPCSSTASPRTRHGVRETESWKPCPIVVGTFRRHRSRQVFASTRYRVYERPEHLSCPPPIRLNAPAMSLHGLAPRTLRVRREHQSFKRSRSKHASRASRGSVAGAFTTTWRRGFTDLRNPRPHVVAKALVLGGGSKEDMRCTARHTDTRER